MKLFQDELKTKFSYISNGIKELISGSANAKLSFVVSSARDRIKDIHCTKLIVPLDL